MDPETLQRLAQQMGISPDQVQALIGNRFGNGPTASINTLGHGGSGPQAAIATPGMFSGGPVAQGGQSQEYADSFRSREPFNPNQDIINSRSREPFNPNQDIINDRPREPFNPNQDIINSRPQPPRRQLFVQPQQRPQHRPFNPNDANIASGAPSSGGVDPNSTPGRQIRPPRQGVDPNSVPGRQVRQPTRPGVDPNSTPGRQIRQPTHNVSPTSTPGRQISSRPNSGVDPNSVPGRQVRQSSANTIHQPSRQPSRDVDPNSTPGRQMRDREFTKDRQRRLPGPASRPSSELLPYRGVDPNSVPWDLLSGRQVRPIRPSRDVAPDSVPGRQVRPSQDIINDRPQPPFNPNQDIINAQPPTPPFNPNQDIINSRPQPPFNPNQDIINDRPQPPFNPNDALIDRNQFQPVTGSGEGGNLGGGFRGDSRQPSTFVRPGSADFQNSNDFLTGSGGVGPNQTDLKDSRDRIAQADQFDPSSVLQADRGFNPTQNSLQQGNMSAEVKDFLMQQLSGGLTGDDAITQSQIADFDADAGRARAQQIEDLQRFGVLGDGVSSGSVADILGEFDSGTTRGRAGVRAGGAQRLLSSILPQASAISEAQEGRQQQESQFGRGLKLQNLQRQDDVGRFNLGLSEQGRQFDVAAGEQQVGRLQQADQFGRGLRQQESQFGRGLEEGQGARFQQGQQFGRGLAEQTAAREQQAGQFDQGLAEQGRQFDDTTQLAKGQLTGNLDGTRTIQDRALEQQGTLAGRGLDLQGRQVKQAEASGGTQRRLAEAQLFGGDRFGRRTLGAQELEQRGRALDAQSAFQEAGLTGLLNGNETLGAQQLAEQRATGGTQRRLAEAQLFGGDRFGRQTLGAQQLNQQGRTTEAQLALQRAGISGQLEGGDQTLAAQQLAEQERQFDRSAGLQETQLFGGTPGVFSDSQGRPQTLAAQQRLDQTNQFIEANNLAIGQATGSVRGQDTLAAQQLGQQGSQFDRSLREQRRARQQQGGQFNQQLGQQDRQFGRGLAVDQMKSSRQNLQEQARLAQQGSQFDQQFGLSSDLARAEGARADERFNVRDPVTMALAASQAQAAGADMGNFSSMNLGRELNELLNFEKEAKGPGSVTLTPAQLADMAQYGPGPGGQPPGASGYTQEYGHTAEQLGDWGMSAQQAQDSVNDFWEQVGPEYKNPRGRQDYEEDKRNLIKQHGPPITIKQMAGGMRVTFADGTTQNFDQDD